MSRRLRERALALGFSHAGFARAETLDSEGERLRSWLGQGKHADMDWMTKGMERRIDPRNVLPGAASVIVLAMNYHTMQQHSGTAKISRYAWGRDYHKVLDRRMKELEHFIVEMAPGAMTRRYVDTGPIMEKAWAARAGIGWPGKHTNIITRDRGSWIFLGTIITTAETQPDTPVEDYCGSCTACIDACPTAAITEAYSVDSRKCISYLTIEHRGDHDTHMLSMDFDDWVFGCDVCQDVCPWNRFAQETDESVFSPDAYRLSLSPETIIEMDEDRFRAQFSGTPVTRAKLHGLQRNARTVLAQRESNWNMENESVQPTDE